MRFAEIIVLMSAGGFVIGVIALVVRSIFFRKVIKYYSKYSDGVDIGVSSNDELYEWLVLRSAGNLKPQKAPYGITLDGYHFAVDSKNKVRASLPQFGGERLSFCSFTEVSAINSIFDGIVKMSSPGQIKDDSTNKRVFTWQRTNNVFYIITNIAFILMGVGILALLLMGYPATHSDNSLDDQYKYSGNEAIAADTTSNEARENSEIKEIEEISPKTIQRYTGNWKPNDGMDGSISIAKGAEPSTFVIVYSEGGTESWVNVTLKPEFQDGMLKYNDVVVAYIEIDGNGEKKVETSEIEAPGFLYLVGEKLFWNVDPDETGEAVIEFVRE